MPLKRRRLAARRRACGYSQEAFAEALQVDRTTVARWESGDTEPQPWHRRKIAGALDVSLEQLDELLGETSGGLRNRLDHGQTSGIVGRDPGVSIRTLDEAPGSGHAEVVRRDEFFVLAGSALGLFGTTLDDATRGSAYDPADLPAVVDPAIVDHFAVMRAQLVETDNRLGVAVVLPTVLHHLGLISRLRRQAHGSLHDQLLSTESRWAELAGWLSDDLGDRAAGAWWLGQSMSMAQEANDHEFTAYLFARMAQRAASGIDEDRTLGLAQASARVGAAHAHVRAFASLQRACGYAVEGETYRFESAISEARSLINGGSVRPGELGAFCTVPYVVAHEGVGWLKLKQPKTAVQRFAEALAEWPSSYERDRGLWLSRAAAAQLANQEPEEAATTAMEALRLAETTRSARVVWEVVAVSRRLSEFGQRPATASLQAAVAQLTQTLTMKGGLAARG